MDDGKSVLAFSSDTGPTERFWEVVNHTRRLKAVITEASFPNDLQELANASGHLTPQTLHRELEKLKRDVPVYIYGFKPKHLRKILAQLRALKRANLQPLEQGRTYTI